MKPSILTATAILAAFCSVAFAGTQNININIEQSRGYSEGRSSVPDTGGYQVVYSHVHEFRGGYPIDVPIPGVDGGFLRLEMKNVGFSLCGGLLHPSSRATTHEMVNAGQITRDQPRMPCLLGEWTYRAVDRDGTQLGVLVTMVNPGLTIHRRPMRVRTPHGWQIVEQVEGATMSPALRVTIWRQQ